MESQDKIKKKIEKFLRDNFWYIALTIALSVIFVSSLVIKKLCDFDITKIGEVVGTVIQVISTIITLIVSIIGLITSLQNEECYGIRFKEIYKLRTDPRIPYDKIIVISISLCFVSTILFFLEHFVFCLGINLLLIAISVIVSIKELPIILGEDYAIERIIRYLL